MVTRNFVSEGGGVLSKLRADGRKVYYIRYTYNGRRIVEKVGLSEGRARGRIEARREALEDPAHVPAPIKRKVEREAQKRRVKFKEFSKTFLRDWAATRKSEKDWFQHMVRTLNKTFGNHYLDSLTRHMIERHLAEARKTLAVESVNHRLRFIRNMLNRAVEWGYLKTNPTEGIRQLRREENLPERYLTQSESDALIGAAASHLRPIIQTALLTGMRRAEILNLTWDRVDVAEGFISIVGTKSGRRRSVPIGEDLRAILKGLPRHVKHKHVFTYKGKPVRTLKRSWAHARETAKVKARFHDLRHTWASRMAAAGVSIYELMDLGGWQSIMMVQRYAKFAPDHKLKTARLLDGTAGVVSAGNHSGNRLAG